MNYICFYTSATEGITDITELILTNTYSRYPKSFPTVIPGLFSFKKVMFQFKKETESCVCLF